MDDLRERVRRELDRIEPTDSGLEKTLQRAGRRQQNRRMIAGLTGLVLTAALVGGLVAIGRPDHRSAAPAPEDLIAFSRGGSEGGIYVMRPDGTEVTRLTGESGDTQPAWSPDGSRVAFVRFQEGIEDIYVVNADGSGVRRLTSDGASSSPAWSPDGARLAFARETSGNAEIYVMDPDGGHVTRLTDDPLLEYTPAWSPDGTKIAFVGFSLRTSGPPSPLTLHVMNADGSAARRLGPPNVAQPSWSPDGRRIAFVDSDSGSISMINADGTDLRLIVDLSGLTKGMGNLTMSPTWSPDGTKLVFASGSDASSTHVYAVDMDGSDLMQLTHGSATDADPAWSIGSGTSPRPPSPAEPSSSQEPGPASYSFPPPFVPMTGREGDMVVVPVTFPDGTTAQILYPADLHLTDMGVQPDLAYLITTDPSARYSMVLIHGQPDPQMFDGAVPVKRYANSDPRTELWRAAVPDPTRFSSVGAGRFWLVMSLGRWTVLAPAHDLARADDVAAKLHARETPDGFVALEADPPVGLSREPGEGRGPELTIGDRDPREGVLRVDRQFRQVILWPVYGDCKAEGGLSNIGGSTVYTSKCFGGVPGGSLFASIYGDPEFVRAVANGLEARGVQVAP